MLNRLSFENFKTWPQLDIELSSITGLFGTNSSGKTSILQFILMLKQTKETTDRAISLDLNGPYVSLGTFKDMIFDHDETYQLRWSISLKLDDQITILDPAARRTRPLVRSDTLSISGSVKASNLGPSARFLSYMVGTSQSFTLAPKRSDESAFDLKAAGSDFRFTRTPGRAWQLPGPIKSYAFPDQARTYFQNATFLADLEKAYEDQLDRVFYLGPLREPPKRDYTWARTRPRDVGVKGEKVIDAILAATANNERRNLKPKAKLKSFQEMIAFWLSEMGLIHGFLVKELAKDSNYWQAEVVVSKNGPHALLTDVGFGISQVLPIVTLLYYVPEGSTVILEQPEIHLHPLAQSGLADMIINVSERRRLQVIFESHSEHLLLRMQRRIAEEAVDPSSIKLYFCNNQSGASQAVPLLVDRYGQIDNWPKNFMGDAFGETLAAEKARLRRMRAA